MRIGLIDVDSHNFPNLALMKISAYHKKIGDEVEWCNHLVHYDIVYKSKVFSDEYSVDDNTVINAKKVVVGGTGYGLEGKLPDEIEHIYPDYSLYPKLTKDTAYGFLTRGCPRNCPFCIVSKKEGKISKKVANLSEFWRGQKNIKLLDPNILACKENRELLQQLVDSKANVDFTQGLDARLVTSKNIEILSKIKVKMVHFAFDLIKDEKPIVEGLKMYKQATTIKEEKTGVYILTNYNTTIDEDLYRIKKVQELGYRPYVMIFEKNKATKKLKELQRWCNNRIIYYASGKNFGIYGKIQNSRR